MAPAVFDTDVLIVGAGPTGLLLANLLGRMQVRTLLVERNLSTVPEPRAVSIDDESMRALQAAGLDADIAEITAKGYGSLYHGPSGRVFAMVKPSVREYGFDKRNAFAQPQFEARLRTALSRHASVTACFGTEFTTLEQDAQGVTVELTGPGGVTRRIRARYLAACDGGRSPVRHHLGIALEGSTFTEPWLIVDLGKTENPGFHTEVFCDPARAAISLPGPGGIRRYEFKLNPGETIEQAETEAFARALMARIGPDEKAEIRRLRVYTFHARSAERWQVGRVFLCGDAAHLTPPFAGQGMNSGLRDAHNLAWKLDEALRMAEPEALLASYQIERKPHAQAMIDLALRMGRVMMPNSALASRALRAGFALLGLYAPAKEYFAQMKYKPRPRFADGMIDLAGARPGKTAIGQMIPQPLVVTPDRQEVLLDSLLPDQPVALVFAEHPQAVLSPAMQQQIEAAGAAVVGLTPEWMNALEGRFPTARDRSRFFSAAPFADYLGQILLLRRDRYLAGAARPDDIQPLLTLLGRIRAGR